MAAFAGCRYAGWMVLVLAQLCCGFPVAAGAAASAACPDPLYRVSLSPDWRGGVQDGIASYRRRSGAVLEGVTLVAYAAREAGLGIGELRGIVDRRRGLERGDGDRIRLSGIAVSREAGRWHLRYSGVNRATGRRFLDLTIGSACSLQHLYYEALHQPAAEFEAQSRRLLAQLGRSAPPAAAPGGVLGPLALPRGTMAPITGILLK